MVGRRFWDWRRKNRLLFFFLGFFVGLVLVVAGVVVENGNSASAAGVTIILIGVAVAFVWFIWGLVDLGLYLVRIFNPVDRPAPPADSNPVSVPVPAGPATVKILVLGDSGSGKTTMLAALYHSFSFGRPDGIRFVTGDAANRRLRGMAEKIMDSRENSFVEGTRASEVWQFGVQVESGDSQATAFVLEYLDYPGGFVRDWQRSDESFDVSLRDPEFERAVKGADVLMGILDGEKVARLMDGTGSLETVFRVEGILNMLTQAEQRNVHLVVTKWDLVRNPGGASCRPRDLLAMLTQKSLAFSNFWENPGNGSVRIIPVSALGVNGFVRADPSVPGGMAKVQGKRWEPWNVAIPFFCAVPDILRRDAAAAACEGGTSIAAITREIFGMIELDVSVAGIVKLNVPVGAILDRVWQFVQVKAWQADPSAELSHDQAMSRVLQACRAEVAKFEEGFPECRARGAGGSA